MLPLNFSYSKKPVSETPSADDNKVFQTYVHPCVINNQPHIVYPRGLEIDSPHVFHQLKNYFSRLGYQLKEDQRHYQNDNRPASKRRAWAPIILFTAGLMFESAALADVEINIDDISQINNSQIELNLINNRSIRQQIKQQLHVDPNFDEIEIPTLKQRTSVVLHKILMSRYQPQPNDPAHIQQDLKAMADYYSSYPEVVSLFNAIKNANWSLIFDEENWTTIASGNIASIEKAEVHFNTRSAAQLRLNDSCKHNPVCIASPADALLHELLHVNNMFNHTENFIAQGGMNGVMYPYQHERNIIGQERNLYQQMTDVDDVKRPYRHNHRGRIVKANCATCIK